MLPFTWRFNEHNKGLKSEIFLEGYALFSPPEKFIYSCTFLAVFRNVHFICVLTQIRKLQKETCCSNVYLKC